MYYGGEHVLTLVLRTRTGRAVTAVVCVVGSAALAWYAVPDGWHQAVLRCRHQTVRAEVTDTRSDRGDHGRDHYAIQYAFTLGGRTYAFHRRFGRDWENVSDAEWQVVMLDRHVAVLYDPADPSNNALAARAGGLVAWAAGLTLVPLGMLTLSIVWLVRMIVGTVRQSFFSPG